MPHLPIYSAPLLGPLFEVYLLVPLNKVPLVVPSNEVPLLLMSLLPTPYLHKVISYEVPCSLI